MEKTVISMTVSTVFLILILHVTFNNVEGRRPGRPCGPVCAIHCPNGNVMDRWGCPTCTCRECRPGYNAVKPIRTCRLDAGSPFQCGRGARCQSTFGSTQGICCRRRVTGPIGQCPMVMPPKYPCPAVIRPEDCQTDKDCPRYQRCCQVGCGRRCMSTITSYGSTRG